MFLNLESARENERDEERIPLTRRSSAGRTSLRERYPPPRNLHTPPLIVATPEGSSLLRDKDNGNSISALPHSPKRQNERDSVDGKSTRSRKKKLNYEGETVQNKRTNMRVNYRQRNHKSPAPIDEARKLVKHRKLNTGIDEYVASTENGTARLLQKESRSNSIGMLDGDTTTSDNENTARKKKESYLKSKELITYFAQLARSRDPNDSVDLKMVDRLLQGGADINVTDKFGQTVMHEVAKNWHSDVANYLIKRGAFFTKEDRYGRTPLHLASAVGHVEMIEYLLNKKPENIHRTTKDEKQTPLHYAAKNNSVGALKILLKLGASLNDRDFRLRTALHVAAENGRIEAAMYLLTMHAPAAVYDDQGVSCLSIMVQKMPGVAYFALQQFYAEDPANRKLYCYLNYLEKKLLPDEERQISWKYLTKVERQKHERELSLNEMGSKKQIKKGELAKSVLEKIVEHDEVSLIVHPAIKLLIQKKWILCGRKASILSLLLNLVFALLWSAVGIATPIVGEQIYRPFSKWWHITVLEVIGVGMTIYFMATHIMESQIEKRRQTAYGKWVIAQAERDLAFCHPRWPEERRYIDDTVEAIMERKTTRYFSSGWNVFDWLVYLLIWVAMATRLLNLILENDKLKYYHIRIFAITLIFIWLRLLRRLKPFPSFGPFIIMLGYVVIDTIKFFAVFLLIYLPYCCAFWMIFGGVRYKHSKSYIHQINDLVYDIFQMSLMGEYNWKDYVEIDETFAQILTGTYMTLASIICISMYIALLVTTFSRKYPQALARALIMQGEKCVQVERMVPKKSQLNMKAYFHETCAPLVEDTTVEPISIATNNTTLSKLDFNIWRGRHEHEIDELRHSMNDVNKKQVKLMNHFKAILESIEDEEDLVEQI